ncbi:MAG: DUF1919 domain-containing protein [Bacteroidota bacterium]
MINNIIRFTRRKIRDNFKEQLSKNDIQDIGDKNFVLISNNCWGGEVYQWYKRPYNSPFIGLFLYGPCYIKLLSNFDHYMNQKIEFVKESKYPDRAPTYPIGKLDDIEVHFTHYESEEVARSKWERRTKRMLEEKNKENYYFKICDRERVDNEIIYKFHDLPFQNKISYSLKSDLSLEEKNHIKINEIDKKRGSVPNGKKLYKLTFLYYDLHKWLKAS